MNQQRSNNLGVLGALLAASLLLLTTRCSAEAITFKVCDGQTLAFKQPAGSDKLEVRCPGKVEPVLTVAGCIGPKVTKVGADYTLTCSRVVPYTLVKK